MIDTSRRRTVLLFCLVTLGVWNGTVAYPSRAASSADGTFVYFVRDDQLFTLDPRTGSTGDPVPVLSGTLDLAVQPDGRRVYQLARDEVRVIDVELGLTVRIVDVHLQYDDVRRIAMAPNGEFAYLFEPATSTADVVFVLDAQRDEIIGSFRVSSPDSRSIAFDLEHERAYFADTSWEEEPKAIEILVVDTSTHQVIDEIRVPGEADHIVLAEGGRIAYVAGNSEVTVVDIAGKSVLDRLAFGAWVYGIALSPDGRQLYVGQAQSTEERHEGVLSIVDTATRQIVAERSFDAYPDPLLASSEDDVIVHTFAWRRGSDASHAIGYIRGLADRDGVSSPVGEYFVLGGPPPRAPTPLPTPPVIPATATECAFSLALDATSVSVVDLGTGERAGLSLFEPSNASPDLAVSQDGRSLQVVWWEETYRARVADLNEGRLAQDLDLAQRYDGARIFSAAGHPIRVVASRDSATISRIDPSASDPVSALALPKHPDCDTYARGSVSDVAIASDGSQALALVQCENYSEERHLALLAIFDPKVPALLRALPLNAFPGFGMAIARDGRFAYVRGYGSVLVVNLQDGAVDAVVPTGFGYGVVLSEDESLLLVPVGRTGYRFSPQRREPPPAEVLLVSTASHRIAGRIPIGGDDSQPGRIWFDPHSRSAHVRSLHDGARIAEYSSGFPLGLWNGERPEGAAVIAGPCPTGLKSLPVRATRTPAVGATSTPSRSRTTTRTPGCAVAADVDRCAHVRVGTATGRPGERVALAVTLATAGKWIADVQNDLSFDAMTPIVATPEGRPDCWVNPGIGKDDTGFAFRPSGCSAGRDCTGVRAGVFAFGDDRGIPAGSVLYTCRVEIEHDALLGDYPVRISKAIVFDREHDEAGSLGIDGLVRVQQPAPERGSRVRVAANQSAGSCHIAAPNDGDAATAILLGLVFVLGLRLRAGKRPD